MPLRHLSWILVAFALSACGGDGDSDDPVLGTDEEYLEAIPTEDQLNLLLTDQEGQALSSEEYALEGSPARVRELTQEIFQKVNNTVQKSLERMRQASSNVEPESYEEGAVKCKRWMGTHDGVEWRLRSCHRDLRNRLYAFTLEGRSEGEEEYLPVFAGEGRVMARFDGKRRGAGKIGYNLDNLNSLTGQGPTGKIGIGYRAVGALRQLHVGLKEFSRDGEEPISARYNYKHLIGVGGKVSLAARADFVTTDENGEFAMGQDDVIERGRISLGWKRGLGARAALVVCNGTIGEGECVRVSQCWKKNGNVIAESLSSGEAQPAFESAECPEAPFSVDEPPSDAELELPSGEDPELPEPVADPNEEEA